MRVAYTLEQCWHRVPGGTAVAALRVAEAIERVRRSGGDGAGGEVGRSGRDGDAAGGDVGNVGSGRWSGNVELIGVAGRHRAKPVEPWVPPIAVAQLPLAAPWLYETWLRAGWPKVERAVGRVDVAHATSIIPCPSNAPLVVTVHDLAFLHDPGHFTKHGVGVFRRSLEHIRRHAALVLCSSQATADDCVAAGIGHQRLRLVPLGVDAGPADAADIARVRVEYSLPERFALFVGTVEPRKNLAGLLLAIEQLEDPLALVVVGAPGWGEGAPRGAAPTASAGQRPAGAAPAKRGVEGDVSYTGFVPADDLAALYAAATVFCYPSLREGYGLPVLEAMAQGTPVVTSSGTSTAEVAGGAAVLVDPRQSDDIARGITEALERSAELAVAGRARAATQTWAATAELTIAAYREVAR